MPGGLLPPLVAELRAKAGEFRTELLGAKTEAHKMMTEVEGSGSRMAASTKAAFNGMATVGKAAFLGIAGGATIVGVEALKMGANFQEGMTSLVTGAGESEANMKAVGAGVLKMAGDVGTGTKQLTDGLYMVESAGFHGAEGLNVLKAAAEGAKVGSADLQSVSDGLTTALHDYHLGADQAAIVTSKLVATVASGKTHMADLAGALATVMPAASAAKVGMNEVLGAMATMTAGGTPAADAATYLKQTIANLSNPTTKAKGEMEALGLSAIDVSQHLGDRGLTGTLALMTDAIQKKMGPAGTVLIEQMKKAAKSGKDMGQVIADLPPTQQTYIASLADMVGGTKSMQAALMLTGDNMATFKANVKAIGDASTESGGHVLGWAKVQEDFNTKLAQAKGHVEALGIKLGTYLIPKVEEAVKAVGDIVAWLEKHKTIAIALGAVIGGVLTLAIAAWIAQLMIGKVKAAAAFVEMIAKGSWWVAKQAAQFAAWVAHQVASMAESAALWSMYAAEWVAKQASAAASWVATQAAAMASWISTQMMNLARATAAGVAWLAEHLAMAAAYIASQVAMAAAATAAFVAENAATLGIVAGIALLVAGIVWMATHWKETWGFIKEVAGAVWHWLDDNIIHPLVHAFETYIVGALKLYIGVWRTVLTGARDVAVAVWNWLESNVFGPLHEFFATVIIGALHVMGSAFSSVWNGIKAAISDVWSFIKPILDTMKRAIDDTVGAVSKVAHVAGGIASGAGHLLGGAGKLIGFADGGVVPGPIGAARLVVAHGGETITPPGGITAGPRGSSSGGGALHVHVHMDGMFVGADEASGRVLAQHVFDHVVEIAQTYARRNGVTGLAGIGI